MSAAPRPYSRPSQTVGVNGCDVHCSTGPGGTTSICPAKSINGVSVPCLAQRLVTPLETIVSQANPNGSNSPAIRGTQPPSAGETVCRLIRSQARSKVVGFKVFSIGGVPQKKLKNQQWVQSRLLVPFGLLSRFTAWWHGGLLPAAAKGKPGRCQTRSCTRIPLLCSAGQWHVRRQSGHSP